MAFGDEEPAFGAPPARKAQHVLGEPLDALSAPELADRIGALKREIERLEAAIATRNATLEAAKAFFKS